MDLRNADSNAQDYKLCHNTTLKATRDNSYQSLKTTVSSLSATSLSEGLLVLCTSRLGYRAATGHLLQALDTLLSSYCSAQELTLEKTFRQGVGELISHSHVHTGTRLENVWTYALYAWKFKKLVRPRFSLPPCILIDR